MPNHMTRYNALLAALRAGETDLFALAVRHNLDHLQMARFIARPRHARLLRRHAFPDRQVRLSHLLGLLTRELQNHAVPRSGRTRRSL